MAGKKKTDNDEISNEYMMRPLADLIPYIGNARTHSDTQVAQIAASIQEFGFTNPVLVDGKDGIIAGHGRVLAARKLKLESVPCVVLSGLTDAQKKAYILADNQLALNSGWDMEVLRVEIGALSDVGFDLGLIGLDFDALAIDELFGDDDLGGDDDKPPKKSDDDYSSFEVVMLHTNKLRMIKAIKKMKDERGASSNEEALMMMIGAHA